MERWPRTANSEARLKSEATRLLSFVPWRILVGENFGGIAGEDMV